MATEIKMNRGSARMFKSDFLEWFSHVHPATPAVIFVPVVLASLYAAGVVYRMPAWTIAWNVAAGYVAWTLTEYWLHRLFFHLPVKGPISERIYFFVHGVHHDWPWDTTRLVMPPAVSLTLGGLFWLLFRGLFGYEGMYAYYAGFVGGYVIYDTVHYYTHAVAARNPIGKWLRREHLIHHFKSPETRFGVSCPWWDYVFRTR